MNKRAFLPLLLCLILLLSGCGAGDQPAAPAPSLQEKLAAALPDWEELIPYPTNELYDLMDLDPQDYTECVCRISDDIVIPREAIAVRAKDQAAADRIAAALEGYLARRIRETRDYLPEAYLLLNTALVSRQGLTVVLIVGANAAQETRAALARE